MYLWSASLQHLYNEAMTCFKRAGANVILTYYAKEVLRLGDVCIDDRWPRSLSQCRTECATLL